MSRKMKEIRMTFECEIDGRILARKFVVNVTPDNRFQHEAVVGLNAALAAKTFYKAAVAMGLFDEPVD